MAIPLAISMFVKQALTHKVLKETKEVALKRIVKNEPKPLVFSKERAIVRLGSLALTVLLGVAYSRGWIDETTFNLLNEAQTTTAGTLVL